MSAIEDKIRKWGSLCRPPQFPSQPDRFVVVGPIVFARVTAAIAGAAGREARWQGRQRRHHRGRLRDLRAVVSTLASLKAELGDLDRVKRLVRLFGMVNARPASTACRKYRRSIRFLLRAARA